MERGEQPIDTQSVNKSTRVVRYLGTLAKQLIDSDLQNTLAAQTSFIGAKRIALTGYKQLFEDWLPFYWGLKVSAGHEDSVATSNDDGVAPTKVGPGNDGKNAAHSGEALQRLLLRIMSTLDDTCIIKRVGEERAQHVKREAAVLLKIPDQVRKDELKALCGRYAAENISPGGAADMLSLTIFIDSTI